MARITEAERRRTFGDPCTTSNLRTYLTPWGLRVQVHSLVVQRLAAACDLAKRSSSWVPRRADSYSCREIRGATVWSLHAYGLAWDWFATPPGVVPPGGVWEPDDAVPPHFAAAFEHFGFTWGATFTRPDVPHIEWADGRPGAFEVTKPQEVRMARIPNVVGFCITGAGNLIITTGDGAVYAFNRAGGTDNAGYIDAYNRHPELGGPVRGCIGVYAEGDDYTQVFDDGARYTWRRGP